jgi:hypothetical protein
MSDPPDLDDGRALLAGPAAQAEDHEHRDDDDDPTDG